MHTHWRDGGYPDKFLYAFKILHLLLLFLSMWYCQIYLYYFINKIYIQRYDPEESWTMEQMNVFVYLLNSIYAQANEYELPNFTSSWLCVAAFEWNNLPE